MWSRLLSIITLFLFAFFDMEAQSFHTTLSHFGVEEGLSHREINVIHQDQRGLIWVGTPQGINSFDGYKFERFNQKTDHFLHENIWKIIEDDEGYFWLLPQFPKDDISIWHPVSRELTSFSEKFGNNIIMPNSHESDWIQAANDHSVLMWSPDEKHIMAYHSTKGLAFIELNEVSDFRFIRVSEDGIWGIADRQEIVQLDLSGKKLKSYPHHSVIYTEVNFENHGASFLYRTIDNQNKSEFYLIDRDGNQSKVLASTMDGYDQIFKNIDSEIIANESQGFKLFFENFKLISLDTQFVFAIDFLASDATYRSLYFSKPDRIWVGNNFGLYKIDLHQNHFDKLLYSDSKDKQLHKPIRGIEEDDKSLYIHQEFKALKILDKTDQSIDSFQNLERETTNLSIEQLNNGKLLLGQRSSICLFDKAIDSFYNIYTNFQTWASFQLDENQVWLGTDSGLRVLDPKSGQIEDYNPYNQHVNLSEAHVTYFLQNEKEEVWICSNKGIFVADREKGIIDQISSLSAAESYIPHDLIYHAYQDEDGTYWLASGGGGLIHYTPNIAIQKHQKHNYKQYLKEDGLSNEVIYAIYPDNSSRLWMSSDHGIICFDKQKNRFITYLESDGISHHEFNRIAHHQSDDGTIYFGSLNGVTKFHPDSIRGQQINNINNLVVRSFQQFDAQENKLIDRTAQILNEQKVTIYPNDRFFSIELALLNYENPEHTKYAYRITGLTDQWTIGSGRTFNFGKLPYGKYELQFKAQNSRGNWSDQFLTIPIISLKPFYLQAWFLILAGLLFLSIGPIIYYVRIKQFARREAYLESEIFKRTTTIRKQAEELKTLDRLKSRFFTNVSHELRTPLTLILGPLGSMLNRNSLAPKDRKFLKIIQQNGKQLLKLVNEILDLSKLEAGRLELKEKDISLFDFLEPIIVQFKSIEDSEKLRIHLDFQLDKNLVLKMDPDKVEKILHNYFSNAIKFLDGKGEIHCIISDKVQNLRVELKDNGPGIHPDDLPHIFDRFYQSKQIGVKAQGGTGIGLSLCKELAELMGGKVWVESEYGKGSRFFLEIPMKEVDTETSQVTAYSPAIPVLKPSLEVQEKKYDILTRDKSALMVVEDNPDLRSYLELILSENYKVSSFPNGLEAWQHLSSQEPKELPSLIISDIMMPVMDGLELLKKLKGNKQIMPIPVILLTARADRRVKLRALRTGVDDYLIKPFVEEELLARIENLIKRYKERMVWKEKLDEVFLKSEKNENHAEVFPDFKEEETWMQNLEAIVSAQLNEENFSVEVLAEELNLSRRQLLRKTKSNTGLTPDQYIRELRLMKARMLLELGKRKTVKEVAWSVKFRDEKYFSRIFKQRFGIYPSQLM